MRFRSFLFPAVIIILGLGLRLYNLERRVDFAFDQEVAAWWVKNLLVDNKFSAIGQETSAPGVFVAPFFYYFLTPFYFLTRLYPLGASILTTLVSLATMTMIFRFAHQVFGRFTAAVATFLYAIHPGIIAYDLSVAPSNMVMLLSVSTAHILAKTERGPIDFLLLGIIFGLAFSIHPTALLLIPICLFYFLVNEKRFIWQKFLLIFIPAVLFFSPLAFFDFRHHGQIARSIFFGLSKSSFDLVSSFVFSTQLVLVDWAGTIVSSDFFWIKVPLFLLVIIVFWRGSLLLKLWVAVPWLFLLFYPRHAPEYYLLLIVPVVLVYTVGFLSGRKILLLLVVLASILTLKGGENKLSLYYKNQAANHIAQEASGRPVTVYFANDPGLNSGFSYLLWWHQVALSNNSSLKFQIIIPETLQKETRGEIFGGIKVVKLPK